MFKSFWGWILDGNGKYMPTYECIGKDKVLTTLVVLLNLSIVVGYFLIAKSWFDNRRRNISPSAKTALGRMVLIFFFCGITGYGFQIIRFFYPLWPLYILLITLLSIATWAYIFESKNLTLVYRKLEENTRMFNQVTDILDSLDESQMEGGDPYLIRKLNSIKSAAMKANASVDLLLKEYEDYKEN